MPPKNPQELLSNLTERQEEVLELICEELKYEEIADKLYITVSTVKRHASDIRARLQVGSNEEVVEKYCPLLREEKPSPTQEQAPDEQLEAAPEPETLGDELFLEEPSPPRRSNWVLLLIGAAVGMCLAVVVTVGVVYVVTDLWRAEGEPKEVTREVTVEVTSVSAPSQPTSTSEEVLAPTATPEDTATPLPPSPTPTDTPIPPTPTDTPMPPSSTPTHTPTTIPSPTPTVPKNTPPGSILEVLSR
jgi:DNA-binding CsgD family transcriptional regulator